MLDVLFDYDFIVEAHEKTIRDEGMQAGMQKGRQEGRQEGRREGRQEGAIGTLVGLVKDGILTLSEAAKRMNMPVAEFQAAAGLPA